MTTTTLAIVNTPTIMDGLVTFLRIGEAAAEGHGVTVYHDEDHRALEVDPDPELPAGVLEYVLRIPVDPWHGKGTIRRTVFDPEAAAMRRELLELLAQVNPDRDLLATATDAAYLS